ncbi:tyrosine-type recombinase/integrase [Frankia sp. CiP3]|uniref:tyrosine-type recombinase/integrase n=1 Tax=Frankia sp. CiP3 TaxID=2880971 RepID=UPI001EF585A7|nr:tyrosine-type recombinase/integrase [Frankia sp. CiP3]
MDGPLAPFAAGVRQELLGLGYAEDTVCEHMHLLADLSGWLAGRQLATAGLTSAAIEGFLRTRRAEGRRTGLTIAAVAPMLTYLRAVGAAPPAAAPAPPTPLEVLLADYRDYLEGERALAESSVSQYLRCARGFLTWLPDPAGPGLADLSAGQVINYVRTWAARRQSAPTDMVTLPALRSLLRFLHLTGTVTLPLAGAVPASRGRPVRGLPRAANGDDVRTVLARCDRDSASGRREFAILLMLARLAVRGGEIARLRLEDIGWRSGEVTIRGKGGRVDTLPLPADAGEAMADYLLHARPASSAATLFLTLYAPFRPLTVSGVTQLVKAACQRAGVAGFSPHRVRHAVACDLLAAGASMEEIGQLLRHADQRTTALYARLDDARLTELARPCPQGAPL